MEEKKDQKIEIRSEEVQDILGQVPSWIVRWGTIVILATIVIIIIGSTIYSYPDVKRADITVTTENPPATLYARSDGQIVELFVDDSQQVEIHTHLAVIENPAEYSDVISLRFDIANIRTIIDNLDKEEYIDLRNTYTLGDIQEEYAEFISTYEYYYAFLERDYYEITIASIRAQIKDYEELNRALTEQVSILGIDYQLAAKQFARDSTLFRSGAIAEAERDRSMQNMLAARSKHVQKQQERSTNRIEISKLNQRIEGLQLTAREEREQMQTDVRAAFEKLIAKIDMWEQNYLLQAPIEGLVSFIGYWSETQYVRKGDKVMSIIPANPGQIIGRIDLPMEGAGKVEIGQTVNIQFANFPHLQFGMVGGLIRSISQVPNDKLYKVEVSLPNGLKTYYGTDIPFRQEMYGRAKIITDNRVLIDRVFSPIRSTLTEQKETRRAARADEESESY